MFNIFGKLDHFTIVKKFFSLCTEKIKLVKGCEKIYFKKSYRIDPRGQSNKNFLGINLLTLFCKLDLFLAPRKKYTVVEYNRVIDFTPKKVL